MNTLLLRRPLRSLPTGLLLATLLCGLPKTCGGSDFSAASIGTAGSEFLNLDVGPRYIAMGGAGSAVVDDIYSLYWNPAGLSRIPRAAASAMHNEYLAGIRMQYLSYAQRINDSSVLGGAVRYMDAGDIDHTDISGNRLGTFRPRNYVYELGWGQTIADMTDSEREVAIGVTARYLHSDLLVHAGGIAGDLGVQVRYTEADWPYRFGVTAQNMGQGQQFEVVRDNLPFRAKMGGAISPLPYLLFALDAVFPISNQPYGAAGIELSLDAPNGVKAALRAGYNGLNQFSGLEGLRGLSGGIGIKLMDLSIDYAFVPFGLLGDAHRFSLSWSLPAKRSRRFRER
ncbi:MAG: PorV/PorQ family protein [Elusimicrobiota bacterium]|jgi:hypothetical protein